MYDTVITLKSPASSSCDEYGNEIIAYDDRIVYAMPRSVYSNEYYNAAQNGLHPSIVFEIANRADYDGQRLLEWQGKLYNVIRTDWNGQRDKISLICEERVKNG